MSVRLLAALAGVGAACNPLAYVKTVDLRSVESPYFVPSAPAKLKVILNSAWYTGRQIGILLHDNTGVAVAAARPCEPMDLWGEIMCPIPPLAVGTYPLLLSSDASCGESTYAPMAVDVGVIEPAHLSSIAPAHGPEGNEAKVEVSGSNIGGPHVFCEYTFAAAPGARLDGSGNPMGCSMKKASYPALNFSTVSAACMVPHWPGPLQKCGFGGCKPVEGAVCDRRVSVQVTNDAKVSSPEAIFFAYDSKVSQSDHEILV